MLQFLLGLILFFGMHSISIVALPLRDKFAEKSEIGWKLLYSIVSLLGIVLMARGYSELQQAPTVLYEAPAGLRFVAAILLLPTFVLLLAPYFPGLISRTVKHPQLVALTIWAFAHLLVSGTVASVLLFGSFLLWAVIDRLSMMNRASRPVPRLPQSKVNDIIVVVVGIVVYTAIVFWLHEMLLGVGPFR